MFSTSGVFAVYGILAFGAGATALPQIPSSSPDGEVVVGGDGGQKTEIPYQILLRYGDRIICGGSLVVMKGRQVVLTAAHCVYTGLATNFTVVAGDHFGNDTSGSKQIRRANGYIYHENFSMRYLSNDIAIIYIDRPFQIDSNLAPITLPQQGQETSGQVLVAGWGYKGGINATLPQTPKLIQTRIVDFESCQHAYSQVNATLFPSMFCAETDGKGACRGDSGLPLRAADGDYLAGIVSFGRGCDSKEYPVVNTKVSYYIDWLNANVVTNA